MRILVTGAKGRLGSAIVDRLSEDDVIATDVEELDISDFYAVNALLRETKPDCVIHSAAMTDVDACARMPEKAIEINSFGSQHLAIVSAELGIPMLHISSNEVFPGRKPDGYRESDMTEAVNPYAYSKWAGEKAVQTHNPRHWIVRTSWLFAHGGKNFIQAILKAAEAGKALRVVTNEVANPTYNDDLADAVVKLIRIPRYGIYHLVNEGFCSRYRFAQYLLAQAGYESIKIEAISASEWQRDSIPPEYAGLINQAGKHIGIQLRPWQDAVDAYLKKESLFVSKAN
ncbi:dTDP-4-dehydrorhamnose reductase [Anaerolineales bacterium]